MYMWPVIHCSPPAKPILRKSPCVRFQLEPARAALKMVLRPTVRVPRRIVKLAALDENGVQVLVLAVDAGLHFEAEAPLLFAPPLADVACFDDNVVPLQDADAVLLHVLDRE